jgi:hypothetical protein
MSAAGTIYKVQSGMFGTIPLTSLIDCNVQKGASKSKTRADGAQAFTKIFGEGMFRTVTVRMQQNGNYMQLQPATIGKLSFPIGEQASGSGLVPGGNAQLNLPAAASTGYAYLDSISEGIPFDGIPTVALTFDVCDGNGDPTLLEEIVA